MVLSGFSLSNVATMTSNVISVNTCQLKIAHGGWGGSSLSYIFATIMVTGVFVSPWKEIDFGIATLSKS